MAISREAVTWGFRFFLGREPESENTIQVHMKLNDLDHLVAVLLTSEEFASGNRFADLFTLKHSGISISNAFPDQQTTAAMKILILGNCQSIGLARLIQAMSMKVTATQIELKAAVLGQIFSGEIDITRLAAENDLILMHPHAELQQFIEQKHPAILPQIKLIPTINFSAFHPDLVYIRNAQSGNALGPLNEYHSSLAFYGWRNGLTLEQTVSLFTEEVFAHLGFFDYWDAAKEFLVESEKTTNIPLEKVLGKWATAGCWMYSVNHPKLHVLADIARAILAREGIDTLPGAEQFVPDDLARGPVWPIYPEIGKRLGINNGNYLFKKGEGECSIERPVQIVDLPEFIRLSFASFDKYRKEDLLCDRLDTPPYQQLPDFLANRKSQASLPADIAASSSTALARSNPYRGLPNHQFWRRGIEHLAMTEVDPVVRSGFMLTPAHKVATAGSCFAQHISRTLQKNGFNYYVTEDGKGLAQDEIHRRNFSVFSARYGNLYTARQLVQLFDRAYGIFTPQENHWVRDDGRLVDPFRPQIEPDGFATLAELEYSREEHFTAVRSMFESLDVFVFTLGLTEAWRSKLDGAVYPLAPGVAGGSFDTHLHEFINFRVTDVVADMNAFIERLLRVNPNARMIVTVSPVPLIATYENRHVVVATTYSKSVLRAAAEEIVQANSAMCEYFPSYEIITGNFTKGQYFDNDLRSVKQEGVDHVMRLFMSHYSSERQANTSRPDFPDTKNSIRKELLMKENAAVSQIICDEEAIDKSTSIH